MVKKHPWRSHQSVAMAVENPGVCVYSKCPALDKPIRNGQNIRYRGAKTKHRCEECSIKAGVSVWLCNRTVKVGPKRFKQELCHIKHHCIAKNIGNVDCSSIDRLDD